MSMLSASSDMFTSEWSDACFDIPIFTPYLSYRFVNQSDGLISHTSPYIEEQAIQAWKEWYGPRPVFTLAPLVPPKHIAEAEAAQERSTSDIFVRAEAFLDAAMLKYGKNAVVYV